MGFQLVMGVPLYRWMVFVRENIIQMDDDWGTRMTMETSN